MKQLLKFKLSFKNFFGYANYKNIMVDKNEYIFYEPEIHVYINKKYRDAYMLLCYTSSPNIMINKNDDDNKYSIVLLKNDELSYFEIEVLSLQGNSMQYLYDDTLIFNSYSKFKVKSGVYNGCLYKLGSSLLLVNDNFIYFKIYISGEYGMHITSKIHCINYLDTKFMVCETFNKSRMEISKISKNNLEQQNKMVVGNNESAYKCYEYNIFLDIKIPYTFSSLLINYNSQHNSIDYYNNIKNIIHDNNGNNNECKEVCLERMVDFLTIFENFCEYIDDFTFDLDKDNVKCDYNYHALELVTDLRILACGDCEDFALNVIKNINDVKNIEDNNLKFYNYDIHQYITCLTQSIISSSFKQKQEDYDLHTFTMLISKGIFKKWLLNTLNYLSKKSDISSHYIKSIDKLYSKYDDVVIDDGNLATLPIPILICEGVSFFGYDHKIHSTAYEHSCFIYHLLMMIIIKYMQSINATFINNNIIFKQYPKFNNIINSIIVYDIHTLFDYNIFSVFIQKFIAKRENIEHRYSTFYKKIVSIDIIDSCDNNNDNNDECDRTTIQFMVTTPKLIKNIKDDKFEVQENISFGDFIHNIQDNILIPVCEWSKHDVKIIKECYENIEEPSQTFDVKIESVNNENISYTREIHSNSINIIFYIRKNEYDLNLSIYSRCFKSLKLYFRDYNTFEPFKNIAIKCTNININEHNIVNMHGRSDRDISVYKICIAILYKVSHYL